jgi:hypothetical protein
MSQPGPEQTSQSSGNIPEWVLDPPPPRLTVGRRWSRWVDRRPWLRAVRRGWWRWRDRRKLSDRFPIAVKIIVWPIAWAIALAGFYIAYYLFEKAQHIQP